LKKGKLHRIGITLGDPAGIGPEITLKALSTLNDDSIIPVIIGRRAVLEKHYASLLAGCASLVSFRDREVLEPGNIYIYDMPSEDPVPDPGKGNALTGAESLQYINRAVELWQKNLIDAVVTGPVHKGYIEESGTPFTGHTEHIAALIGETSPFMMMYSPQYRVLLATTHHPIADIPALITPERLEEVFDMAQSAMKAIDGGDVNLAVTGLDPHCGDNGAIGSFDRDVTSAAVKEAQERGINMQGPFAADTLFLPDRWKQYNCVVALYHDQGLIPFKILAFDEGVNITLGLSIVRTSVDHGTAFDIAGKNCAHYSSMVEAIRCAAMLTAMK
jgi:4-hydroxythreonine-4-phosphate dehydrogenase